MHSQPAVAFYRSVAATGPPDQAVASPKPPPPPQSQLQPQPQQPAHTMQPSDESARGGASSVASSVSSGRRDVDGSARVSVVTFSTDPATADAPAPSALDRHLTKPLKLDLSRLSLPPPEAVCASPVGSARESGATVESCAERTSTASYSSQSIPSRYKWQIKMNEVQLLTRLGAGAYGEVYAGRWRRNEVAVKQMVHGHMSAVDREAFFGEMQVGDLHVISTLIST